MTMGMNDFVECIESDCLRFAVERGRCNVHQKERWTSNRRSRLPKDWNTRRSLVLRRDKFVCYICGESGADGVDHVKAGDDHSMNNLRAIHHNVLPPSKKNDKTAVPCHQVKTAEESKQGKKNAQIVPWGTRKDLGVYQPPPF